MLLLEDKGRKESTHMKMPWGKHKGNPIHRLPSAYLWWLAENAEGMPHGDQIAKEADEEWHWREKHSKHIGKEKYHERYR